MLRWDSVTASGSGEQLGVVGQGGTLEPGWDDGITREGATADNDARFLETGEPLGMLRAVTVEQRPDIEGAAPDSLEALGIQMPED